MYNPEKENEGVDQQEQFTLEELRESFSHRYEELPYKLLRGAIDSHVHAGPVLKSNPGHTDPIEIAIEARNAGMKALVYYDVFGWASGTAWMVNRHVKGIRTFGGYLMNSCHNGLNPRAIKTALHLGDGCRFISFGSHCTYYSASRESALIDGKLKPFKDVYPKFAKEELSKAVRIKLEDPVPPELDEILSMISEHKEVYLNVGHVSVPEALRLVDLSKQYNIEKVLICHPVRAEMTVEQQQKLASQGVFLEGCAVDFMYPPAPRTHYYVEREYMDMGDALPRMRPGGHHFFNVIRQVGADQIVLSTDYGIRSAPTAVQGMRTVISELLDFEFPIEDIIKMTATNPARLIGIE